MAASRTRVATWELADATLSSGALLASAGGGLPQRITTPAVITVGTNGNESTGWYNGSVFTVDNAGLWSSLYDSNRHLRKWSVSDGSLLVDAAANYPAAQTGGTMDLSVALGAATFFVCGYQSQKIWEFDRITGAYVSTTTVAYNVSTAAPDGSGKIWAAPWSSGSLTEYTVGGAATGRTIAGSWFLVRIRGGKIYASNASGICRYDAATLALELTIPITMVGERTGSIQPGTWWSGQVGIAIDSTGRIYTQPAIFGSIERWNANGTFDRRLLEANPVRGGSYTAATACMRQLSISDDDTHIAFFGHKQQTAPTNIRLLGVRQITDSVAVWTRAFSSAATLQYVVVPGSLGNSYDAVVDDRKSTFEYSTNGVDFTAFGPGSLLSVSIAAGATLTVRASLSNFGQGSGVPPWIGGDAGEGPSIIWTEDDPHGPDATVTVSASAAIGVTVATPPAITVTVRG